MQPKIDGYYIMGRYTSVAWYPANVKAEAERMVTILNYRGGQTYRVEPDYRREERSECHSQVDLSIYHSDDTVA